MMGESYNYRRRGASEIRRTCGSTGEANHCQILRLGWLQHTARKKERKKIYDLQLPPLCVQVLFTS